MNFLIPVDFSQPSKIAADIVAAVANSDNDQVTLLHVIEPVQEDMSYLPVKTLQIKKNTIFEMFRYQETLRLKYNLRTGSDVVPGKAAQLIRRYARLRNADVIVMGTQGNTGLRDFLYGSTATSIMLGSDKPVLLVSSAVDPQPFKKVVFITNFERKDLDEFLRFQQLVEPSAEITFVTSERCNELESLKAKFLNGVRKSRFGQCFQVQEVSGDEKIVIEKEAHQRPGALLVLSRERKSLIEKISGRSLTSSAPFTALNPILILP
jgi:nucleotide-binding universal stress UspA family protein